MKNIELKNYKTFKGHDGMKGINADIHYNGRKIATVYDDARGGCFDYNIVGEFKSKTYTENKALFSEMCTENKVILFSTGLDEIIEKLITKEDIKKDTKKGVLIKTDWGYEIAGFKVIIPTAIKRYSNGLSELQKICDENVKANKVILNKDYLITQGVTFK